jgi:hypothetical protein
MHLYTREIHSHYELHVTTSLLQAYTTLLETTRFERSLHFLTLHSLASKDQDRHRLCGRHQAIATYCQCGCVAWQPIADTVISSAPINKICGFSSASFSLCSSVNFLHSSLASALFCRCLLQCRVRRANCAILIIIVDRRRKITLPVLV